MTAEARSWRRVALVFGVWCAVALIAASQYYIATRSMGHEVAWTEVLVWEGPVWMFWAFATFPAMWLADRFPIQRRGLGPSLAVHTVVGAALALLYVLALMTWNQNISPYPIEDRSLSELFWLYVRARFTIAFLIYWSIIGISHAWTNHLRYRQRELEATRLREQLAQARLQALKMQLHPHFLFNALHAASSLMDEDVKAARRMLARLSELLRATIDADAEAEEIPLAQELEFLEGYLEIEKVRFRERLRVDFDVDEAALGVRVPPFLLQPLVENAIRHGVAPRADGGRVTIRATRTDGAVRLVVEDDGPGLGPAAVEGAGGIGLRNTRQRLQELYGDAHGFTLGGGSKGGVKVTIDLPVDGPEVGAGAHGSR